MPFLCALQHTDMHRYLRTKLLWNANLLTCTIVA